MDYTKLSLENCFHLAVEVFGLENLHTICLGNLKDAVDNGLLPREMATNMAQIIYHHGTESLYYNDAWDEDEEFIEGADEMGYNPYMGCNDWDC